jgi:hypothetical protein
VGDRVAYGESDPIFGARHATRILRVTRVDEEADLVEVNDGKFIWDVLGNPINANGTLFEPRAQHIPSELQIGRKWTTRFRSSGPGHSDEVYLHYKVAGRDKVQVHAGEFDAFRLEAEGWASGGTRQTIRTWVVPGLNFDVKSESIWYPRNGARRGTVLALISCKQMRWIVA